MRGGGGLCTLGEGRDTACTKARWVRGAYREGDSIEKVQKAQCPNVLSKNLVCVRKAGRKLIRSVRPLLPSCRTIRASRVALACKKKHRSTRSCVISRASPLQPLARRLHRAAELQHPFFARASNRRDGCVLLQCRSVRIVARALSRAAWPHRDRRPGRRRAAAATLPRRPCLSGFVEVLTKGVGKNLGLLGWTKLARRGSY